MPEFPDFQKIIDSTKAVLGLIFGDDIPQWALQMLGYILLSIIMLLMIWMFAFILSKLKALWVHDLSPILYRDEIKRRSENRRRFAGHIEREIERLNSLEYWGDHRFSELEAEVEAEGRRRSRGLSPFNRGTSSGLTHKRSLSKALQSSDERLLLLEGEPGSGKSVALRHVALVEARRAKSSRHIDSIIPIYVNLKGLTRPDGEAIDKNLIESFVLRSLNRANDRDIEEFLSDEFLPGLRQGTWFFLFDSFDEISEVLSSTEADDTIMAFADAISDFLHGMNRCRGIVASRHFRGPRRLSWPRFRILPLREKRRIELVKKANLSAEEEQEIIGNLALAASDIRGMASNPMFLAILCDHMKLGHQFPRNVHGVFESYLDNRFIRDKERLLQRFKLNAQDVRDTAEQIAFAMTADKELGLSPSRQSIKSAVERLKFTVTPDFESHMDALEYIKLARCETTSDAGTRLFSFSHRRFQEYFATCVVLQDPGRVSATRLLDDARWRETAVIMLQTQSRAKLRPLLDTTEQILEHIVENKLGLNLESQGSLGEPEPDADGAELDGSLPRPFPWPPKAIHVLSILQDGFAGNSADLPETIRSYCAVLLTAASTTGTIVDRRWALEVAGSLPQSILLALVRDGIGSRSQVLRDTAYRQAARLSTITQDVGRSIRQALLKLAGERNLNRTRYATAAHLSRLDRSEEFLSVLRLLLWVPRIDLVMHAIVLGLTLAEVVYLDLHPIIVLITAACFSISYGTSPTLASSTSGLCSVSLFHWLVAVLSRTTVWLMSAVLVGQLFGDPNKAEGTPLIPVILASYYWLWFVTALLSAKTGKFNHPVWWPFMPVVSLVLVLRELSYAILHLRNALARAYTADREKKFRVVVFILIMVAFFAPPILLSGRYPSISRVYIWIFSGLAAVRLIEGVIKEAPEWANWLRDRRQWRDWRGRQVTSLTGREFLDILGKYGTASVRRQFIRDVRLNRLLEATNATEVLVEALTTSVEQVLVASEVAKTSKKAHKGKGDHEKLEEAAHLEIPSGSVDFNRWYRDQGLKEVKIEKQARQWGIECLDELALLLEQIGNRKRS